MSSQKESGFTLVELVVSIAVISIVITSVVGLFLTVQTTQRRSINTETATRAAQRQMESMRNSNYTTLVNNSTVNFTSQLPSNLKDASGTAYITEPTPGIKRVDITVTYSTGTTPQEVKLTSLIGKLGI